MMFILDVIIMIIKSFFIKVFQLIKLLLNLGSFIHKREINKIYVGKYFNVREGQ